MDRHTRSSPDNCNPLCEIVGLAPRAVLGPDDGIVNLLRAARSCPVQSMPALLHESELAHTDPDPQFLHRPMRYDIGLPSPVI